MSSNSPGSGSATSPPASNAPIGATILKKRSGRAVDSVCRIEIAGQPKGTGFLVGPDTVLTNYHVIEPALSGTELVAPVTCRFDFAEEEAGGVDPGFVVDVVSPVLDSSGYGKGEKIGDPSNPMPEADELDYALLKLADAVGNKPAPGSWSKRGWITLPTTGKQAVVKGAPLLIVQHPLTAPKVTVSKDSSIIGLNPRENRIIYQTEAWPGSSGSPCLTPGWEIIALHHYGDPAWVLSSRRQGIPIWLIRERLVSQKREDCVPAYRDDVNVVEGFLEGLKGALHDDEVGAKLAKWRDNIINAKDRVARLRAFKSLHDFLHTCQKLLPVMMMAARSTDAANATDQLSQYGANLVDDLERPRASAGKLRPTGRGESADQLAWIEKLDHAARDLAAGMAPADAMTRVVQMRNIIRFQLAKINGYLVDEAADLPLGELIAAFRDFASSDALRGAGQSEEGPAALERLQFGLQGRVKEHDLWQEAESHLWALEDGVALDVGVSRQVFAATWDQAWEEIRELSAQDRISDWSRNMLASGTVVNGLVTASEWPKVGAAFGSFRRLTIARFSGVDTSLLEQCEEVVRIGDPLAALLGATP